MGNRKGNNILVKEIVNNGRVPAAERQGNILIANYEIIRIN